MSAFALKIIAIICMTFDHLSYLIYGGFSWMNLIGRIAFPIFAYQITEGYVHTSNLKKYFFRLLLFSLISQIPFMLFNSIYTVNIFHLNVFFTLLIGLSAIIIFEFFSKIESKNKLIHILWQILGFIVVCILALLAKITGCDYGYYGVFTIFCFYIFKNNKILMNSAFTMLTILFYGKWLFYPNLFIKYLLVIIFTVLPLIFINLYNNKKGKDTKHILYLFYPVHFMIIYLIYLFLQ